MSFLAVLCLGFLPLVQEAPAPSPAAPGFESPRALIEHFLQQVVGRAQEAGDPEGLVEAARVFDLSGLPELQRPIEGPYLAERLIGILDRTELIDPSDFPDSDYASNRYVWRRHPPGHPELAYELVMARGADGTWRLAPETVAAIPSLHRSLRHLPRIEALRAKAPSLHERIRAHIPESWQRPGFLMEPWQWLGLFLLALFGVVLERILLLLFRRWTARVGTGGRLRIEPGLVAGLGRPVSLCAIALAVSLGLPLLDLGPGVLVVLDLAAQTVVALTSVWIAYRLVDVLAWWLEARARETANTFDDMVVPLVRRTLKLFVLLVGVVWLASRVSEDLWGVVAGLGIGSLAVGFAAKDSIENLFGTFTVLLDKPFKLGDWVQVGELEGTVEQVGFRSTRIRTFYDSVISVPNSRFIAAPVDNMGARRWRRINTRLGLTYDTPPEKIEAFCEGVRELIRCHPHTRKDSFHVWLNAFGASSLEVLLYCFHGAPDWATELRERHRLFQDILRLARELGVELAFPTETVHLMRPEDARDHSDAPASPPEALERGRALGHRLGTRWRESNGAARPRGPQPDAGASGPPA